MSGARAVAACLALAALAWLLVASPVAADDDEGVDDGTTDTTPEQIAPTAEDDDPAARALPERVTGLRVKIGGPDSLTVLWDRASGDGEPVLGYLVQRSKNREQWVDVDLQESDSPASPTAIWSWGSATGTACARSTRRATARGRRPSTTPRQRRPRRSPTSP